MRFEKKEITAAQILDAMQTLERKYLLQTTDLEEAFTNDLGVLVETDDFHRWQELRLMWAAICLPPGAARARAGVDAG